MLRHQGIPARARCGFATYFAPDHFEDHWVCEYWRGTGRWVKVDSQLDAFQRERLGISFDPLDVPEELFLVGGRAWQDCRNGRADSDSFGVSDLHGMQFVRGNLIRDLASLNKMELLPWDAWGLIDKEDIAESDLALLDRLAEVTQGGDGAFDEIRSLYRDNASLRVASTVRAYLKTGVRTVEIRG
jgi:hypothetical protein